MVAAGADGVPAAAGEDVALDVTVAAATVVATVPVGEAAGTVLPVAEGAVVAEAAGAGAPGGTILDRMPT